MTSIEWLIEELYKCGLSKDIHPDNALFHKAKEMHKEEIIDAANKVLYHSTGQGNIAAEQYYNETFKNK